MTMRIAINGPVRQMQINGDNSTGHAFGAVRPPRAQLATELRGLGVSPERLIELERILDGDDPQDRRCRILLWCQRAAAAVGTGVTVATLTSIVEAQM